MANNPNDPWLPADPVPLQRDATPIRVWRLNTSTPEEMTSLRCESILVKEGDTPSSAVFRYAFDGKDSASPQSIEQALSTAFTGAKAVNVGDWLAVSATQPDGTMQWIFSGHPYAFRMDLSPDTERVHIACLGREYHQWDKPINQSLTRQTSDPETVVDLATDDIVQFNRKGLPNASPGTADAGTGTSTYPTFLDPTASGTDKAGNDYPRTWTLPMAAAYLIFRHVNTLYTTPPKRQTLDDLLIGREPINGTPFDPTNPGSFTTKQIQAPDTPLSGKPWPSALLEMIRDSGYGMNWPLTNDPANNNYPKTSLNLFLKQAATTKVVYLPARGTELDPATCNVAASGLARDLTNAVNQWRVQGGKIRYEISAVLTPAFKSQTSDASSLDNFSLSNPAAETTYPDAYRTWILAEGGDAHYPNASTTSSTTATSLDAILGAPKQDVPQYIQRRRPPIGTLFTPDPENKPLKAQLAISTNYANAYPSLWDGTGQWQTVAGEWELLPDRWGIKITADNPNTWKIGKSETSGDPFPAGVVNVVESIGNPGTGQPAFFLRLTAVIESDVAISYTAPNIKTSPLSYPIEREIDARDRILKQVIAAKSQFNTTSNDVTNRDDTELAKSEAISYRTAFDSGVLDGPIEIPRFTAYYQIGDRISQISGRGLSLRTDTGGSDYAAVYPVVTAIEWHFEGGQTTALTLSDAGLDRKRYGRTGKRVSKAQGDLARSKLVP